MWRFWRRNWKNAKILAKMMKALAITGTKCVGKDTLFSLFHSLNSSFTRFAFADGVREDLAPFILQHYGFDIWTCTPEQKEIARPMMIAHGMAKRIEDPLYWVKRSIAGLEEKREWRRDIIPVFVDCRFENEAEFLRGYFGKDFKLLYLTRRESPPPTDEEEKHFRQVAAMANFHLSWGGEMREERLCLARKTLDALGFI